MLNRLVEALRQDRWLQIAVIAFIVLFVGFQDRLAAKEELYLAAGSAEFDINDRGPFIVELPASEEVVTQTMVAQLSGRAVHVKDVNGDWHIMRPVIGPSGEVEDHSDTVVALAKLTCGDRAPAEVKESFMRLKPATRAVLCELAGAN
nr:hypothetical protein [Hyphomonas sp. Mor2]